MSAQVPTATLPGSPVRLGNDEVIWRQYRVLQLGTTQKGEGTLYVTDSRVVFFARAKGFGLQRASAIVQQIKLADITGLSARVLRRISLALFLVTCFCAILAIVGLVAKITLLAILFIALTALCIVLIIRGAAKRGHAGVTIYSRHGEAPISFGGRESSLGWFGLIGQALSQPFRMLIGAYTAYDVLAGRPGLDSDQLIAELGALILDLQTRGSEAAEHWQVDGAVQWRDPGGLRQ